MSDYGGLKRVEEEEEEEERTSIVSVFRYSETDLAILLLWT
jgi:hypothetical protein